MKVLLALSGGVDSAVCAHLLRQMGHSVHGLVIRFSPAHAPAVEAARVAAKELDIPLTVAGCEALFEQEVILPFCQAYNSGRTPNPCVVCNPAVKFRVLLQQADALGMDAVATGHYARLAQRDGIWRVRQAKSRERDQSYMLYRLPQPVLERLLLPAGELDKPAIRALAQSHGLSCAAAPDSQEICFIPSGDYAAFLAARGFGGKAGHFVGPDGRDLGPHKGTIHYTVGQRRGLGVSLGRPAFVKAIEPGGKLSLDFEEGTFARGLSLGDIHTAGDVPLKDGDYLVKIRSVARPAPCRVEFAGDGARVVFASPLRSPAPGQHAVLYNEDLVAGGGVIETAEY